MNWLELSRNRLRKVLKTNRVGNIRQLESKICEAGPPQMRPAPDILTKALNELTKSGIIKSDKVPIGSGDENIFYFAEDFDFNLSSDKDRYSRIVKLYREFLKIVNHKKNCGYVLETIMQKAIKASKTYHFVGGPGRSTNNFSVNGTIIKGDFDFILQSKAKLIGVELKNKRKWLYPDHRDLWVAIYRCLENNALPVIIARKFPYVVRLIFKHVGILGYETHNQYLKPELVNVMVEMRDKNGLGFADLRFTDEPEERHINFFKKILPNQEEDSWESFTSNKDILNKYAQILKEDTSSKSRTKLVYQFLGEIGIVPENKEEERDFEEDYGDYYDAHPPDF